MRTLLMAATLAMMPLSASSDPLPRIPCTVEAVTDGDSFTASCYPWPGLVTHARVRVLAIDTPERGYRARCEREADLAEAATTAAEELLQGTIRITIEGTDSFGRLLAHVTLADHRDYGQVMLRRGLALPYGERDQGWC